jgi:tRNA A-37 threonylcarbamoyl transferase component Bud32
MATPTPPPSARAPSLTAATGPTWRGDAPDEAAARRLTLPVITIAPRREGDEAGSELAASADIELVEVLGEGGMGRVFLARQRSLRRDVAVKTLRADADDPLVAEALLREGETMGSLEHPGIVPVHALGRDRTGTPVLVMKRVDGVTLEALLTTPEHTAWQRWMEVVDDRRSAAVMILQEVCDAVAYAHDQGVIHRDIKPANILLGARGEVYLGDWGIAARLDEDIPAQVVGSPHFMAPEMALGAVDALSVRTDVYLLGATLHAVLTGSPRHRADTLPSLLAAAMRSDPVDYSPDVPADLAALCNDATHPSPERRPEGALAFRRRLADHLRHLSSAALAREGAARLDALLALLASSSPDPAALARTATECRYAFAQSLQGWPENPDALAGRERCLRALFAHAVAREGLDAAAALADDLGGPADLAAALDALRARLEARRAQAESAEREARERDVSVGAGQRAAVMLAVALVALGGLAVLVAHKLPPRPRITPLFVGGPAALVTVAGAVTFALRRSLLATRVNRQLLALLLGGLGWITVHRAALLASGIDRDAGQIISRDLFMCTGLCLAGAIAIRAELVACVAVYAAAYVTSLVAPALDPIAVVLATLLGPVLTYLLLARRTGGEGGGIQRGRPAVATDPRG